MLQQPKKSTKAKLRTPLGKVKILFFLNSSLSNQIQAWQTEFGCRSIFVFSLTAKSFCGFSPYISVTNRNIWAFHKYPQVTAGLEFQLRSLLSATFNSCRHLTLFTTPFLYVPEDCKRNKQTRESSKAVDKNSKPGTKYISCTNDGLSITQILSWPKEQK